MVAEAENIVAALRPVFSNVAGKLAIKADTDTLYALVSQSPSPFPQHKGHPLDFGSIQVGKAYVSLHLMPLYMSPTVGKAVTPALKKRMQGKSCFNFAKVPEPEILANLQRLAELGLAEWTAKSWI
jgi:hypothetical protein